jgi:hypothetical protein
MFLFWRIILSHVLGDFPLQIDSIYFLKVRSKLGGLVHGSVFILLNLLLGWPYLGNKLVLGSLIAIGLVHTVIDGMKISFKGRYSQGETVITFLSDQLVHLAVIIAFILPLRLPPPEILSTRGLAGLYYSDKFVFYSIAYMFAAFGGLIVSAALKNTFSKGTVSISSIPHFERFYGLAERALITFLVMAGFNFWPVAAAVFPRLIPAFRKKTGNWPDALINYGLGLCIGLILRRIY